MSRAVGRKSLGISKFGRESLDMSRAVGRKSLDIPKFGRESLDMGQASLEIPKFGRESLEMGCESLDTNFRDPCLELRDQVLVCPDSPDPCPDFRDQILVCPDFCGPRRDSCPDFPDLMSRLSRLKLSARLCNLGLNPEAARPLARLMSRLSRLSVQTLQTEILGANMQFGSKSGCGATLGATHVQTFQTLCPDSNSRRDYPIWISIPRDYPIWISIRRDHGGYGATTVETVRPSRPKRGRREFPDHGREGATFHTKANAAQLSRPSRRQCDFPDRGGDGATKLHTARFSRPRWRRHDFPDQGLCLESRAVFVLVLKVAPSPPSWSEKSRRLRLGPEFCAVSTRNAKVAPLPLRSRY